MREGDNRGVRGAGRDPGVRSPARKEEVDAVEDEVSPDASTVRPVSIKPETCVKKTDNVE
jgi:hypothetical protein